ncbi:MAG: type I methionyl aminopeptidase [bacterium]
MSKLEAMRQGGKINRQVMGKLFAAARPGVSLKELDSLAEKLITENGGIPSFKGFNGFPAAVCVNINNTLIHGIPTNYILQEGDLLTIDQGVYYKGFHTDHAVTQKIRNSSFVIRNYSFEDDFLRAGRDALAKAVSVAVAGNHVGDISHSIQSTIEKAGFFVVRDFVGHGVGEKLHQEPQIPCTGSPNTGPKLYEDQTLAIEVMYLSQKSPLDICQDNWTIVAKGAKLSALFEKTIMVRRNKPIVLT